MIKTNKQKNDKKQKSFKKNKAQLESTGKKHELKV